jgi:hypothetical protein
MAGIHPFPVVRPSGPLAFTVASLGVGFAAFRHRGAITPVWRQLCDGKTGRQTRIDHALISEFVHCDDRHITGNMIMMAVNGWGLEAVGWTFAHYFPLALGASLAAHYALSYATSSTTPGIGSSGITRAMTGLWMAGCGWSVAAYLMLVHFYVFEWGSWNQVIETPECVMQVNSAHHVLALLIGYGIGLVAYACS